MKVLFLDVDGVLNSRDYMKRIGELSVTDMDSQAVNILIDIVKATDCNIVVSSTWRYGGIGKGSDFYKCLKECDPKDIILNAVIGATELSNESRGDQILNWIDYNNHQAPLAIVDDDGDMGELLQEYFIKTSFEHGLTTTEASLIIDLLGRK